MCGICGIQGILPDSIYEDSQRMLAALGHRGPDARGEYRDPEARLFLGATRLSIVDLTAAGVQPIFNEERSLILVCNGEIYNAPILREELRQRSHRFHSMTDIEVIVHLYEEMGERCVEKLEGMFAFVIWDNRKKSLFAARDRLGIKPLYYYHAGGVFAFASELKALMKLPFIKRELDLKAADLYFALEYVPAPFSIYQGVSKLMPGSFLVHTHDGLREHSYWNLENIKSDQPCPTFAQAGERLEELLKGAVKDHLVADVPVGVLLSGGLDSSALAAFAARNFPGKCRTFSIGFEEESFDESRYARQVARFLGTHHHHDVYTLDHFLKDFSLVTQHLDEPLGDLSVFPTHFLSRFVRQHVKTALSGEGGDELFMGYPTYPAHKFLETFKRMSPGLLTRVSAFLAGSLPVSAEYFSLGFKARQFLRAEGVWDHPSARHLRWMGAFTEAEKSGLYSSNFKARTGAFGFKEYSSGLVEKSRNDAVLKKIQYMDIYGYLTDDLLVKADRASMAASLELRVPFLDRKLMEFAWSLPAEYIFQKKLFRSVVGKYLPRVTTQRKKKGFAIPFTRWLQDKRVQPLVDELFDEGFIKKQGLFEPLYVKQMLVEHKGLKKDHRKKLGTYIMFQAWFKKEKAGL